MQWYWIIGSFLTAWAFLTVFANEQKRRLQVIEAERAIALAEQVAKAAQQTAGNTEIHTATSPKKR